MIKKSFAVLCSVFLLSSCGEADTSSSADMVVFGGPIYTANDAMPTAEAVAVKDGRIVYVGDVAGLDAFKGKGTDVIDLEGAAMYPGFTDAHGHLLGIGEREMTLNLEGTPSLAALVAQVAERVKTAKPGEVVTGRGWIETHWPEGRFPNRHDLDAIAPDNPVILQRADGHARVINSAALSAAGITASTKAPYGGDILKDDKGEPTGMLIDAAMALIAGLITDPSDEDRAEAFAKGGDVYAAYGWTGVHSMSVDPRNVAIMERLSDEGALSIRVYNSLDGNNPAAMEMLRQGPRSSTNDRVITRAIKLYMDGALGSRGAALLQPYSDAETQGLLLSKKEQVMPMLIEALERGIQMNTHAIGDRGNRLLLDWYEEALNAVPADQRAIKEPRWRDEHTQIVDPDDIPRFK
ncbi:MAG: amidohydrolase, partial [Sphingomonadales bacterium]|nr:amidohydrolase [Sphingomonadales bacterium]